MRLRAGLVKLHEVAAAEDHFERSGRHLDEPAVVVLSGFEKQDARIVVLDQATGRDAARAAAPDDDEVELLHVCPPSCRGSCRPLRQTESSPGSRRSPGRFA